jgi:hypothetical protein
MPKTQKMTPDFSRLGLLALAWLGYFVIHSTIASPGLKQRIARHRANWMPAYRLSFNLIAVLLLLCPLWLLHAYQSDNSAPAR